MNKGGELILKMGLPMAKRFVNAKIIHWEFDEFISVRTETKSYWEDVLKQLESYIGAFNLMR